MAVNPIVRPSFFEGQILAAADLSGELDYARGQLARHERLVHGWGIADGLELVGVDRQTPQGDAYKTISVNPGLAIDGTGRELLVADNEPLSEQLFQQRNVASSQTDAWYPVLLVGHDEPASPGGNASIRCPTSQPTRVVESCEVTFGRPGEEFDLDKQTAPPVSDGPGGGPDDLAPWRVLLGFVQWSVALARFTAVADSANGIARRYLSVVADRVEAQSGLLLLRSRPATVARKPIVVLDDVAQGGELAFGLQDGRGGVTKLFTVNAKGDVAAAGTLSGVATAGVYVESGMASDGVVLPLPAGITEEALVSGDAVLHISIAPHVPASAPPDTVNRGWTAMPVECAVDEARRVRCRVRWILFPVPGNPDASSSGPQFVDRLGTCDYTVVAVVASGKVSAS